MAALLILTLSALHARRPYDGKRSSFKESALVSTVPDSPSFSLSLYFALYLVADFGRLFLFFLFLVSFWRRLF